jgi:hypothetical protein
MGDQQAMGEATGAEHPRTGSSEEEEENIRKRLPGGEDYTLPLSYCSHDRRVLIDI